MDRIVKLNEILAANPGDAFARYGLAIALESAGEVEQALREFGTILQQTPDYVPAYQMSAQYLVKLGRVEQAKERLAAGLAACERTGNAHATSEMQALLDDLG